MDNEIIVDDDSIGNRRIVKIYLDILKLSEITVYALLDYLYTDKFTVTSHKRAALGQLAQFVGLTDLADACRSFGITHIQRSTFESDVRWMAQDPMFADIAFKSSKVLGASHSLPLTAKLSTNHSISDIDNDFIEHSIIGFSHSFVLKRIPFFENLLSGNYMETKVIFNSRELREINLDDVMLEGARNEVFFKILTYTYSGFLSSLNTEDVNEIIELLVTSNRLGIVRLSAFCEKEVALHLADYPENAENVLDFAREWNFPRLIQQCRFYKTKLGDNADLGGVLPG